MREIDDNLDTSFDDFSYINEVDEKEKKIKRNKMSYKDRRNLISVSKVRINDKKIFEALEKAREDFIKRAGAIPRLFGIQNTVLVLLSDALKDVKSIDEIENLSYDFGDDDSYERFVIVSFPKTETELFNKLKYFTEKNREKFKIPVKAFGVSSLILQLVVNELIKKGYLK